MFKILSNWFYSLFTASSEDVACCRVGCFSELACKRAFSETCPKRPVECARGLYLYLTIFESQSHFADYEDSLRGLDGHGHFLEYIDLLQKELCIIIHILG